MSVILKAPSWLLGLRGNADVDDRKRKNVTMVVISRCSAMML